MNEPLTLGLVLTLEANELSRRSVLQTLGERADVTCGQAHGFRLPLALETQVGCDKDALAALGALPGVVFCDVVYAHFHDSEDAHEHATT